MEVIIKNLEKDQIAHVAHNHQIQMLHNLLMDEVNVDHAWLVSSGSRGSTSEQYNINNHFKTFNINTNMMIIHLI